MTSLIVHTLPHSLWPSLTSEFITEQLVRDDLITAQKVALFFATQDLVKQKIEDARDLCDMVSEGFEIPSSSKMRILNLPECFNDALDGIPVASDLRVEVLKGMLDQKNSRDHSIWIHYQMYYSQMSLEEKKWQEKKRQEKVSLPIDDDSPQISTVTIHKWNKKTSEMVRQRGLLAQITVAERCALCMIVCDLKIQNVLTTEDANELKTHICNGEPNVDTFVKNYAKGEQSRLKKRFVFPTSIVAPILGKDLPYDAKPDAIMNILDKVDHEKCPDLTIWALLPPPLVQVRNPNTPNEMNRLGYPPLL